MSFRRARAPKPRGKLTLGIAIWPRGCPFQPTVSPWVKVMTASKGPELVMAPTRPVVKAAKDEVSQGCLALESQQRTRVRGVADQDGGNGKDSFVDDLLHDGLSEHGEQQLREEERSRQFRPARIASQYSQSNSNRYRRVLQAASK